MNVSEIEKEDTSSHVENEFSGAMLNVHDILQKYPETRDSDKLLWIAYLAIHCKAKDMNKASDPYLFFKEMIMNPNTIQMATVIRCRAKIQNEKKLFVGTRALEKAMRAEEVKSLMINGNQ